VNHLIIENAKHHTDKQYIVEEPAELLDFLLKSLTGKSRNNVKSLLTNKTVSVNGKTVTRHNHPLKKGQTVTIASPEHMLKKQFKQLKVIYEDDELIAIDKPAGLLSVATDKESEKTAYHYMTDYVRLGNPKNRIFVVHRLDRETSGVLIAAKNEKLKLALQDNWSELVTTRSYTAVVEGIPEKKSGQIKSWIKETKTLLSYSSGIPGDGLEAVTNYEVADVSKEYALIKVNIDSGRKNQIRVHMKDLGHPVAGDKKYGAATNPLGRLCLHADKLEFRHPFTDRLMVFESAVPQTFLTLLQPKENS
jgi:23S rRNA pseudouridine1911/1915/1917 synthase